MIQKRYKNEQSLQQKQNQDELAEIFFNPIQREKG